MRKVKNAIQVFDICSLNGNNHKHPEIQIEPFGAYLKEHPNLHVAHGHSFYHIVVFTKGSGFHTIDFEQYPVNRGEVYFMMPGQVHSWQFDNNVDGYVINFSEDFFNAFIADKDYLGRFSFLSDTSKNVYALSLQDLAIILPLLATASEELVVAKLYQIDMVRLVLLSVLIHFERFIGSRATTNETKHPNIVLLNNFRKLVNTYFRTLKLPKEYAAMLYITPNHLNSLCKDLLGKPAGEIIRERILLEAKRQLVNANSNIAGIGYDLGFTDNSYFTKFFKKYAGATPEDFKRKIQEPQK